MKKILVLGVLMVLISVSLIIAPGTYVPPANQVYLIKSDDYTSAEYSFLQRLQIWINENYEGVSSSIQHNSKVTKAMLMDKVGIFYYDDRILVVLGDNASMDLEDVAEDTLDYLIELNDSNMEICDHLSAYELEDDDLRNSICGGFYRRNSPEVKACVDSDKGKNFYQRGETTGWISDDSAETQSDVCVDGKKLREYYCGKEGKMFTYEVECKFGCDEGNGVCIGTQEEVEPPEDKPVEIPKDSEENKVAYTCNGCKLEEKCYPFGYRKDGKFCHDEEGFIPYLEAGAACENYFECKSNLCADSECVSGGLVRKVISWLKRFFGEE